MKYQKRTITLLGEEQKKLAIAAIQNAPLGIEMVLQEKTKVRTMSQNDLMWAGPLKDIAEQGYVNGMQFSVDAWHEHFKNEYLPDENDEPYLPELVKNPSEYRKWALTPNLKRTCIASTTDLTKYGISQYLEQIYRFGAELGVLFKSNPKDFQ